jgi:RHS repeat-associated protein
LTRITRLDQSTINLGYDSGGRLSSLTEPLGVHHFDYDGGGHLLTASSPDGGGIRIASDGPLPIGLSSTGEVRSSVMFSYDNNFRLSTETVNGGAPVSFGYDDDDLLTSAGALTLRRDAQNGLLAGTNIGILSDVYSYNAFGEAVSYDLTANGSAIFDVTYQRDDGGRITQKSETVSGQTTTTAYSYDSSGRLTDVSTNGSLAAHYDYDDNGNRTRRTTNAATEQGTYDAQDRLTTYNGASYSYSADGELQSKIGPEGTTLYFYDVLGNLRRVTLPNGTVVDYVIDAFNRRVGKKVNGALMRGWVYADGLRLIAELNADGTVLSRFVYASRANVPDYMVRSGVTYRIISDHLGSPRFVLEATSNTLAQTMTYDEFGNVLSDSNPGFQPFGFAGGLYDADAGLTRFGARDYDPGVGRWTTKDPIGFAGGDSNLYGYGFDDPINLIDPSGLDALTQDPLVRQYFYDLWRTAQYGHDSRERAGWVTQDPVTQAYGCKRWPWSAAAAQETWKGSKPLNTVALAHTHPDSKDPKPSMGGTASDPHDEYTARVTAQVPIYTISRKGIWKVDPQGHVTQEEGTSWYQNINEKSCTPCSK